MEKRVILKKYIVELERIYERLKKIEKEVSGFKEEVLERIVEGYTILNTRREDDTER